MEAKQNGLHDICHNETSPLTPHPLPYPEKVIRILCLTNLVLKPKVSEQIDDDESACKHESKTIRSDENESDTGAQHSLRPPTYLPSIVRMRGTREG
jgi:hypothetical protein